MHSQPRTLPCFCICAILSSFYSFFSWVLLPINVTCSGSQDCLFGDLSKLRVSVLQLFSVALALILKTVCPCKSGCFCTCWPFLHSSYLSVRLGLLHHSRCTILPDPFSRPCCAFSAWVRTEAHLQSESSLFCSLMRSAPSALLSFLCSCSSLACCYLKPILDPKL